MAAVALCVMSMNSKHQHKRLAASPTQCCFLFVLMFFCLSVLLSVLRFVLLSVAAFDCFEPAGAEQ